MNGLLAQALVYLAAGVISVPVAKRLGLGSVLGYLIAGAVIGPFALGLVGEQADVMKFAEFGVVILLFLIGLEVRPALLWSMRVKIFGLGGAQVVVTGLVVAAATMALGLDWRMALATGLILAMSSTAIVLQSLEERGLRQGPVGQAAFGVLLFQDLAVIPMFALLPMLAPKGAAEAAGAAAHASSILAGQPGWLQALAVLLAVAVVVGGGRYLIRPVFRFIAAARLREIFTATALLLVVAVAALMELVGMSPALGAFLAGVVLAESEFRRELETDIEPFRGLFLGLFFITVGASLNFGVVIRQPFQLIGAVAGLMALKGLVMWAAARLFRLDNRAASTTGAALSQVGEFAFVLLTFAVASRILSQPLADFLTAAVALSMAATPFVMAGQEKIASLRPIRSDPIILDPLPFDGSDPDVIVAGFGRFGQVVGRLLRAANFTTVVLDASIEHIDLLRKFGRPVHYGDASRIDLLRSAGAEKAKILVMAIDDRDKAVEGVAAAREAFPNLKILARAWDRRHAYELYAAGADHVEREMFEGALAMGEVALNSLGLPPGRAEKVTGLFREQDIAAFHKLTPLWGEEDNWVLAARDSNDTMERVLAADVAALVAEDEDGAWPVTPVGDLTSEAEALSPGSIFPKQPQAQSS